MSDFFRKMLDKHFSKVKFWNKSLWKGYLSFIAVFSSIITLISFFRTAKDFRIASKSGVFFYIFFLVAVFLHNWWKANRAESAFLKINNTHVEIVIDDIFKLLDKDPKERSGECAVIAVNDYYDDNVDNRIVAEITLHGKYVNRIKKDGKLEALNLIIDNDEILNEDGNWEAVPERTETKKRRYKIGSVLEFESYILTAFTKFDENNKAFLSAEDYMEFWMRFWNNIDTIYAGRTINIPLMGAGITRFRNGKPTKQQLLETMLWSMKVSGFHNTYGNKKIRFIIYKDDASEINFYRLQHEMNLEQ